MSRHYADTKIKQALKLSNGNAARARQQIIALAQDDMDLLKALARPHLDGIVAYQVERVVSGRADSEKDRPEHIIPEKGENFGMDLLRAIAASDVTIFGQEDVSSTKKRKAASQQHIEAIHKLAAKNRDKKKK